MGTVAEIEAAIERLAPKERRTLEERLLARHWLDALDTPERAELIASLNEADAGIDRGEYVTAEEAKRIVRSWFGR